MSRIHAAALSLALAAASLSAQQLTPPVLLPTQPIPVSIEKCKKKKQESNDLRFSVFITSDGEPRRISFLKALGNPLDQTVLDLIHADRFTPARRDGEPAAVWQTIDVTFESCRQDPKDKTTSFPTYALISEPDQKLSPPQDPSRPLPPTDRNPSRPSQPYKVGGDVSAPIPLNTPEAHYSLEARKKKIQGVCLVSVIVDSEGMPQNPRVVRPAGYGLDANALESVRLYRFKPALKDGTEPVPVVLSIEVNFRLY